MKTVEVVKRLEPPATSVVPSGCRTSSEDDTITLPVREPGSPPAGDASPRAAPRAPLADWIPCRLWAGWEEVDGKAMACSGAVLRLHDRRGAHRIPTGRLRADDSRSGRVVLR